MVVVSSLGSTIARALRLSQSITTSSNTSYCCVSSNRFASRSSSQFLDFALVSSFQKHKCERSSSKWIVYVFEHCLPSRFAESLGISSTELFPSILLVIGGPLTLSLQNRNIFKLFYSFRRPLCSISTVSFVFVSFSETRSARV